VKHALSLPNAGSPERLVEIARMADESGWDAVFLWDHVQFFRQLEIELHDPFVLLGAIAHVTARVRIGAQVTAVARRRVATFAKQIVTLDHLSGGRVNVGVGLGFPDDEFTAFGEPADLRRRAAITDEMLEVLPMLWSGEPVTFDGEHVHVDAHLRPPTVQQPRPPIWIGCLWPNPRAVARARRVDGIAPLSADGQALTPETFGEMMDAIGDVDDGYDFVASVAPGFTEAQYEAAGATWIVDSRWPQGDFLAELEAMATRNPSLLPRE
jgi:alkanesulfonate monooxygenase SsuD/methylene tetrahydromethanopterin reductase-like flavin-dependent oxidoreductase (luciferase family)